MSAPLSCALGIRQPELDGEAAAFFREAQPWAFVLFREACADRGQVRALAASLRQAAGREALVFIDQEGGRVARLKPPEWPAFPSLAAYGARYEQNASEGAEAVRLGHRLIAHELREIGVDGNFAPVLDRRVAGADPIVGDRAFSCDAALISLLGAAALAAFEEGGVVGCIKHIPGHGRATADSHLTLPRVRAPLSELEQDFAPFRVLNDAPCAMTAHIVYEALDSDRPATCSPIIVDDVIRGEIGFQGLLISDDLDMQALAQAVNGGLEQRARAALDAGCDVVLQCSGKLADMRAVAAGCRELHGLSLVRARAAESFARRTPAPFDAPAAWARFGALMGQAQGAAA